MAADQNLINLLMGLDGDDRGRDKILKAPFGYPGGKSRCVKHILPRLPQTDRYVEAFGGAGSVLLSRRSSKLEVLNDRYSGVTDFYKVLRDPMLYREMVKWLDLTCHSREEFVNCKATWENCRDPVERAARWYYMIRTSFGALGRNFGRATSPKAKFAGAAQVNLKYFPELHKRLFNVTIENQDWEQCLVDYDHKDTVFYLDPPYLGVNSGTYKYELTDDRHHRLADQIFKLKGFVALSGYPGTMYDDLDWDETYEWEVATSIASVKGAPATAGGVGNGKGDDVRLPATECLWIKR